MEVKWNNTDNSYIDTSLLDSYDMVYHIAKVIVDKIHNSYKHLASKTEENNKITQMNEEFNRITEDSRLDTPGTMNIIKNIHISTFHVTYQSGDIYLHNHPVPYGKLRKHIIQNFYKTRYHKPITIKYSMCVTCIT